MKWISQEVVVLMRKAKEHGSSISAELPRRATRFKVLRGEGDAMLHAARGGAEPWFGQVDECPGGHLENPMWLPGHLFDDAGGPETRMPSAVEN